MSLLDRIFGRRVEKREGSWDLLAKLGTPTLTGGLVSPAVVEGHSAAFAAVQLIAQTLGTLPLYVYRRSAEGVRSVAEGHPVQRLFGTAPNDLPTPAEFVTVMQANCLLHGWAAAEVERDRNGAPRALWPVHPGHAAIERIPGSRRFRFQTTLHDEGVDWRDQWCLWCGTTLPIDRDPRRKFCNRRCGFAYCNDQRRERLAEARADKTCALCGGEFVAQKAHRIYCSRPCANRASRLRSAEPRLCAWCGTEVPATKPTSRFCSKSCSARWHVASCVNRSDGANDGETRQPGGKFA